MQIKMIAPLSVGTCAQHIVKSEERMKYLETLYSMFKSGSHRNPILLTFAATHPFIKGVYEH